MSKTVPKRLLAWLLAAMVALIVAPSAAFAQDYAAGSLGAQEDADSWGDIADDAVVFTVLADEGDGVKEAKKFTKAEMESLSKANTTPAKYAFSSKKGATVAVATKYVTISQLLAEANVGFEEGDTMIAWSDSFTPSSTTSYEGFNERKFFPAFTYGADTQSSDGAESTPAIIAIEYGTSELASGSTAASMVSDAQGKSAYNSSGLRNFWGKTEDELTSNMGGNSYCSGATYLTVATPFKIYTRTGAGTKTLVKSYTAADLKGLATTPESAQNAPGFLFNKNGWQVGTTTSYIPIETLLSNAGITLAEGQVVQATASDGFTTSMSYDQVKNAKYFYPATTPSAVVADGAETVGAVLALNWGTTPFGPIELSTTAGEAKAAMFEVANTFEQQTRVFVGLTSPTDSNTGGNRFATGPVEICVTTPKDVGDSSITVSGVETSYAYTGEAIEPTVTVKDGSATLSEATRKGGDYSVTYENNTAVGTGKVIIAGVNAYTGTKTIEFKINGIDISGATVTAANGTYTGKELKPAPTVKLGSTTLKSGTDYTVSYKNNKNAGTATVTVTGKGNYAGTTSGSFKIAQAASTIKLAEQSKAYTGKAIAYSGKVTKTGSTGKVTYQYYSDAKCTKAVKAANVKKAGTYYVKATVAAKGNYKAATSKAAKLTVKVASNTAKVKTTSVKKSFTAAKKTGKLAVAKTVALPKVTTKFGTAKWSVKAKDSKKVLSLKAGKVQVKKGAKKGTYTIKLVAKVAKTANYKAASSKVVTVKVTVK